MGDDEPPQKDQSSLPQDYQVLSPPATLSSNSTPVMKKEYSIEDDLVKGSLSFQANMFFLTAENLFSIVVDAYKTLQQELSNEETPPSNHETVMYVMQAAAVVNYVLENVSYLEKTFLLESKHFCSIYHIFAILIFQNEISEMEVIVGPEIMADNPECCYELVSLCIRLGFMGEAFYLNERYFYYKIQDFVVRHLKGKLKPNAEQLEDLSDLSLRISATAGLASSSQSFAYDRVRGVDNQDDPAPIFVRYVNREGTALKQLKLLPSVHWLKNYGLLAGKMGLLHTFSKIEVVSDNMERQQETNNEGQGQMTMQQIMDMVWARELYPCLFNMCRHFNGMRRFRESIGRESYEKMTPFLRIFEETCPMPTGKGGAAITCGASFAAAFSVHALVYGAYILQHESRRIGVLSKLTLHKFKVQVNELLQQSSTYMERHWDEMIVGSEIMTLHKVLGTFQGRESGAIRAFWNPLFAGSFLNTVSYVSSLSQGMLMPECLFAIRVILHMYNGLRQRHLINSVDLLEALDRVFLSLKQETWQADGKPERGGILRSFLMANVGHYDRVVDRYIAFLRIEESDETTIKAALAQSPSIWRYVKHLAPEKQAVLVRARHLKWLQDTCKTVRRTLKLSLPMAASSSFELLFNYSNAADQPSCCATTLSLCDLGESCSQRAALIKQKMKEDHELLSFNWFNVGHHVNAFWTGLLNHLGINELIEDYHDVVGGRKVSEKFRPSFGGKPRGNLSDCDLTAKLLADMVFRELEFADDSQLIKSREVAKLMTEYFSNVATLKDITFF